jgi:DNA-binding transcriptional ArsR family regulator
MKHTIVDHAHDYFLSTLSNKKRLAIIMALRDSAKNVTQLTEEVGVHQTTISHSLRRLLDCGFVFVKRNGKERVYGLNKKTIKPLLTLMNSHVERYCRKRCCG